APDNSQLVRDDMHAAILLERARIEVVGENVNICCGEQTPVQLEVRPESVKTRLNEHLGGSIGSARLQIRHRRTGIAQQPQSAGQVEVPAVQGIRAAVRAERWSPPEKQ